MKAFIKRLLGISDSYQGDYKHLGAERIPGWFNIPECRKLHSISLFTNASILEIGHFLGRTTACICEGIKDAGRHNRFVSYDLGFRSDEEFKAFYDTIHQQDIDVPEMFSQVFQKGKTTTEMALENLRKLQLELYVELVSGNFIALDQEKYGFIFCDAVHEPHEIQYNLPHIIEHSEPYCIWAFHDMDDKNIEIVMQLSGAIFVERIASLGVFVYPHA